MNICNFHYDFICTALGIFSPIRSGDFEYWNNKKKSRSANKRIIKALIICLWAVTAVDQ